jgi:hypothetical protein
MPDTRLDRLVAQTNIGRHVAHLEEHAQHNLRSSRRELNKPSLANRLPRELLAIIFTLCLPPAWDRSYTFSQFLAISHACRSWRDTFLDTPTLWAILPCDTVTQTLMALQRAGDAPRMLSFQLGDLQGERKMSAALKSLDMPHVRRIELHCLPHDCPTIRSALVGTAPHLLHLSIWAHGMTDELAAAVNQYAYGELIVPCLVHLYLKECPRVLCTLRSFHRLRSLSLMTAEIGASEALQVPLRSLISLLQGTAELEFMKLRGILPDDDGYLSNLPDGSVHLPHLRRLVLYDYADTSLPFTRTLHCPVLSNAHITLWSFGHELAPPVNEMPLETSYFRLAGHRLHSVSFLQEGSFYKLLVLTTHRDPDTRQRHNPEDEETGFSLELDVSMRPDFAGQVTRIIRDLVSCMDIRSLELGSDEFGLLDEMLEVSWPPLAGVRELWVRDNYEAFTAIRALDRVAITRDVGANVSGHRLLMPKLEELHFLGEVNFLQYLNGRTLCSLLKERLRIRAGWGLDSLVIYFHEKTRGVREKDLREIMQIAWVKAFHCDFADMELTDESDIDGDNE